MVSRSAPFLPSSCHRFRGSREVTISVADVDGGLIDSALPLAPPYAAAARSPRSGSQSSPRVYIAPKRSSKALGSGKSAALRRSAPSPTCVPLPPCVRVTLVPEADGGSPRPNAQRRQE